MHENDRGKKLNTFGNFENKTPTHMDATHVISNSERNFRIRIPRELDQTFYIPRISVINWFSSNYRKQKNAHTKKLHRFLFPEFNLVITVILDQFLKFSSWQKRFEIIYFHKMGSIDENGSIHSRPTTYRRDNKYMYMYVYVCFHIYGMLCSLN